METPRTLTSGELARLILTTRLLPDRPHMFRQQAVTQAVRGEGYAPPDHPLLQQVLMRLWRNGFLERSAEKSRYRYRGGSLNTYWYRFASAARESERPGYRPGETYYERLWRDHTPLAQPRTFTEEALRRLPPTRGERPAGIPDPEGLTWLGYEQAQARYQGKRVELSLGADRLRELDRYADRHGLTRTEVVRTALDRFLQEEV